MLDYDIGLLERHLSILDLEISRITDAINVSRDPESDGLCDAGEYFIGHGLVAIQHYLTFCRAWLGVSGKKPLAQPPMVNCDVAYADALNAGANYWKHHEEWFETLWASENAKLKSQSQRTLSSLEKVTPWESYTCSNLLAILTEGGEFQLSTLLPKLKEWRENIAKLK